MSGEMSSEEPTLWGTLGTFQPDPELRRGHQYLAEFFQQFEPPGPAVPEPPAFGCPVCEHVGFYCGGHDAPP